MRVHPTLLVLVVFAIAGAAASAQSTARPAREVEGSHDALGFRSRSFLDHAGPSQMSLDYDLRQATLRMASEGTGEASVALAVHLTSLIEFLDEDGDGRYGIGDLLIQRIALPDNPRAELTVDERPEGEYTAWARYPLNTTTPALPGEGSPGPLLELQTSVVRTTTRIGGWEVDPHEAHLQLRVQDFELRSSQGVLALEVSLEAAPRSNASTERVTATDGRTDVSFVWSDRSEVGGLARAVGTTLIESSEAGESSGTATKLVLTYDAASDVRHEATLGLAPSLQGQTLLSRDLPPGHWGWYLGSVAAGAVVIGLSLRSRLGGGP